MLLLELVVINLQDFCTRTSYTLIFFISQAIFRPKSLIVSISAHAGKFARYTLMEWWRVR
jgi:hypothetical protein